jgi:hypothetical protein
MRLTAGEKLVSKVIDFEAARKKRKAQEAKADQEIEPKTLAEPQSTKPFKKKAKATGRAKKSLGHTEKACFMNPVNSTKEAANVIDVTERIAAQQAQDRRQVQRVVFNEFISAHVYIPGKGLLRVILKNIHNTGLGFDVEESQGSFPQGEEVEMRFYLNQRTFFRFICRVIHTHYVREEGVYRHGCQFVANTVNEVALKHFIGFLENISASLMTDKGDRTISKIYS